MKNILLLAACLVLGAATAEAHLQQEPMTKATKKAQRKARRQNGPEVYKGSVAEQRRIVTEAAGAEKDDDTDVSAKKAKRKNK